MARFLPRAAGLRLAVALLALATPLADAAHGARIVLEILDGPNRGFNATRRVSPLVGNPATTLGEQRVRAFEAAARELERRLVSNVEVRVSARFDSLTCTANSATLAQAGPNVVVRDFAGAPRPDTWFAVAIANALFGNDVDPGGSDISVFFNDRLDGSASCLGGSEWDYSISGGAPRPNTISFVDVARHELIHGLGFTTFVNEETGERFLGFDDSYMVNLEDHSTGKRWDGMSNAERARSATDFNDLHWVGGAVQGHSHVLADGFDEASGHPELYAPTTLEPGSSVSHWDLDVGAKYDELMEPSNTPTSELMLSQHALQDVGWGVDFPVVRPVADVDGNGVDDLAIARVDRVTGAISTVVVDPRTGVFLTRSEYVRGYAVVDMEVMASFGGTAADEVAVLARNPRQGAVQVYVSDTGSGEVLSVVGFDPRFTPLALAVVPDFGGGPADELAVMVFDGVRGSARVLIKDGGSGQSLRTLAFADGYIPIDVDVVPSIGGTPADELAVLVRRPDEGFQGVFVRDASSGNIFHLAQLPADLRGQFVRAVDDFGGGAAAEIAVLGQGEGDGPARTLVFDAGSLAVLSDTEYDPELLPQGFAVVSDFAGTPAQELAVMGRRAADGGARVLVADASTGAELYRFTLPATRLPVDVTSVPHFASSPADEIGLMVATATDFRLRVFVDDPVSGLRVATVGVPFDGEPAGTEVVARPVALAPPVPGAGGGDGGDGDGMAEEPGAGPGPVIRGGRPDGPFKTRPRR